MPLALVLLLGVLLLLLRLAGLLRLTTVLLRLTTVLLRLTTILLRVAGVLLRRATVLLRLTTVLLRVAGVLLRRATVLLRLAGARRRRAACAPSADHARAVEGRRPRCGRDRRVPAVVLGEHARVRSRLLNVLMLRRGWLHVRVPGRMPLLRSRSCDRAASTAVVAHAVVNVVVDHRGVVHHGLVVRVMHDRRVDVRDRLVIRERVAYPAAAGVAGTVVAVAIIHAAVEADVRAPVAGMERIDAADESPVTRGPQQANTRRSDPGARHPEVSGRCVAPVTGSPDIALHRAGGLLVFRERRRRLARLRGDFDIRGRSGRLGCRWRRRGRCGHHARRRGYDAPREREGRGGRKCQRGERRSADRKVFRRFEHNRAPQLVGDAAY